MFVPITLSDKSKIIVKGIISDELKKTAEERLEFDVLPDKVNCRKNPIYEYLVRKYNSLFANLNGDLCFLKQIYLIDAFIEIKEKMLRLKGKGVTEKVHSKEYSEYISLEKKYNALLPLM